MTLREPLGVGVWAVHGPPRPVLVVAVTGEIDRCNEDELWTRIREVDVSGTRHCRQRFGARSVSPAVVVDVRAARFVAVSVLARIANRARYGGPPLRLLLDPATALGRALERVVAILDLDIEIHHDIVDAVLAEIVIHD